MSQSMFWVFSLIFPSFPLKMFILGWSVLGSYVYIKVNTFQHMWPMLPMRGRGTILLIIPFSSVRTRSSAFGVSPSLCRVDWSHVDKVGSMYAVEEYVGWVIFSYS